MKKNWKVIASIFGIFVYIAVLMYISSTQSDYALVFSTDSDSYEFSVNAGNNYELPVTIKNNANRMISSSETDKIFMSYHLYDSSGQVLSFDNARTSLGRFVYSRDSIKVPLQLQLQPGEYIVEIDMVEEGITWFSEKEDVCVRVKVTVK